MRGILALCAVFILCSCEEPLEAFELVRVDAAQPDARYAGKLRLCARLTFPQPSCSLEQLPPLGIDGLRPTIDGVMARTAVSHEWMAARFEQVLSVMPEDMLELMRPVTAVIIASDIRPSFYWSRTGAIYLDPAGLWLTREEKAVIDPAPDFRLAFGRILDFRILSRYVRGNEYAWPFFSLTDDSERSFSDILLPIARLLYHELAHANDFLPPASYPQLNRRLSVSAAIASVSDRQLSAALRDNFPLSSELMFASARTVFAGVPPDATLAAATPADIGAAFSADVANDDYGYFTRFEDLAMLFEETMLAHHFDLRRDIAVTNQPSGESPAANDYLISWGQRGRINADGVAERAEFVASNLLPATDWNAVFNTLPPPESLPAGVGWIDALDPQASPRRAKSHAGGLRADQLPVDAPAR